MLRLHGNKPAKGFTLIELMIVTAIIGILAAIAIPNFIAYRNKSYCSSVELDVARIGTAISDYYGIGSHVGIPTLDDLHLTVYNPTIIQPTPDGKIEIIVTDKSNRCPIAYMTANPHWDAPNHNCTEFIQ